ncbi:MAG TPA: M55 family metallopeptidase [Gaiellales bacterium]|jgi:D-amino peptidase
MRVFIISDMEGVAGITNWGGVDAKGPLYDEGRTLYTEEINAAVRGATSAGATEIVVMDCHGAGGDNSFNSLRPDLLDDACEFVVQREWTEYTGVLEDGCDAALFVGMHAMAGTGDGQMSHTVSGTQWRSVHFNGREVGETGINAALCGTWGCPVLLVTGDQAACREGTDLLGAGLATVQVKTALGRFSARHKTPAIARRLIEAGARTALADLKAVAPYDPGHPCEVRVELGTPDHTEQFRHHPVVEIVDPRTIVSRADDWWTAWRQFYFSYRWPE